MMGNPCNLQLIVVVITTQGSYNENSRKIFLENCNPANNA